MVGDNRRSPVNSMRPLLVLAGTFAPQRVSDMYYDTLYPSKVIALPGGGRDRLHRTYSTIVGTIQDWALQQDEPVVLAGHSQGAIHALSFALDHPHLVHEVVGIAGPFDGARSPSIAQGMRPHVKRILPVGLDFQSGSSYLCVLQARARNSVVPVTLVAGKSDALVSVQSAHAISPSTKVTHSGGHTTVLHQRSTKHLLRELRER